MNYTERNSLQRTGFFLRQKRGRHKGSKEGMINGGAWEDSKSNGPMSNRLTEYWCSSSLQCKGCCAGLQSTDTDTYNHSNIDWINMNERKHSLTQTLKKAKAKKKKRRSEGCGGWTRGVDLLLLLLLWICGCSTYPADIYRCHCLASPWTRPMCSALYPQAGLYRGQDLWTQRWLHRGHSGCCCSSLETRSKANTACP